MQDRMPPQAEAKVINGQSSLGLRCPKYFSKVSTRSKKYIVTGLIQKYVPLLSRNKSKILKLPLKFLMLE